MSASNLGGSLFGRQSLDLESLLIFLVEKLWKKCKKQDRKASARVKEKARVARGFGN